jgi:Phage terminase large subunit
MVTTVSWNWFTESNASLSILKIPTAKVFEPLLLPGVRYRGAWGGRGSGKSHFFGELLVETCQAEKGMLAVCIREAQKTLAQSSKRLIESKIRSLRVGAGFRSFSDRIETPGDGVIIFRGMQYDAGKYRLAQKTTAKAAAKDIPSVQRPGVAASRTSANAATISVLTAKLDRTGSLRDAQALLAAQRRANAKGSINGG